MQILLLRNFASILGLPIQTWRKFKLSFFLKNYSMWRSTKSKVSQLLTFTHFISDSYCLDTSWYLNHSDIDNSDFAYQRISTVYNKYFASSYRTQKRLAIVWWPTIILYELRLIQKVGTLYSIYILNDTINRRMPSVIVQGWKESLINCTSLEMFC